MARFQVTTPIKFGTDGWRALIGDDFTLANAGRVAAAMSCYLIQTGEAHKGVVVGYDARFLSPEAAERVAGAVSSAGVPVYLAAGITPTPAVSYAVVERKAAGGIMITASHNPYRWNGIKFKASYGGSAAPSIVAEIEKHLDQPLSRKAAAGSRGGGCVSTHDLTGPYLRRLKSMVNLEAIRASGLKFAIDPMYGAARGLIAELFAEAGIPFEEIHTEHNPLFPGLNPEPIEPHVEELRQAVMRSGCDAGLATDGDADRIGAIDRTGSFIDSHKIFCILLSHLAGSLGKRGDVVRTFSTTTMVDKIARRYNLPLHVTPIGFKYVCELMLSHDVLIGGEESGGIGIQGHLPERDGILNSLLLAEVMAQKGRTLGELVGELNRDYGPHYYGRVDLEIARPAIDLLLARVSAGETSPIAGRRVLRVDTLDGVKMVFDDPAWLLVRASGTENMLRVYAEAESPDAVKRMLNEMTALARDEDRQARN